MVEEAWRGCGGARRLRLGDIRIGHVVCRCMRVCMCMCARECVYVFVFVCVCARVFILHVLHILGGAQAEVKFACCGFQSVADRPQRTLEHPPTPLACAREPPTLADTCLPTEGPCKASGLAYMQSKALPAMLMAFIFGIALVRAARSAGWLWACGNG